MLGIWVAAGKGGGEELDRSEGGEVRRVLVEGGPAPGQGEAEVVPRSSGQPEEDDDRPLGISAGPDQ